jgi:hypothetical protein
VPFARIKHVSRCTFSLHLSTPYAIAPESERYWATSSPMAPPSFGPPDHPIPQRYMNRTPPPEGADTNTQPYVIFISYMLTCLLTTVFIVAKLLQKNAIRKKLTTSSPSPSSQVYLFSTLAVGSLLTTWTFMVKYFGASYRTWLMWWSYYELEPHQMHYGLWLRETSLFREAWETVIVGTARYWWSHQIFFFALGLGLYSEQKGVFSRRVQHKS